MESNVDNNTCNSDVAPLQHCQVVPGDRVGPFRLGMSLHEALNAIRLISNAIPPSAPTAGRLEDSQQTTRIVFSRESPVEKPIILDVQKLGTRLRFEPKMQKLYLIDIYDVDKLSLSFQGHVFGGTQNGSAANDAATLKALYEVLGVTHSGHRNSELDEEAYCLQYPGLLMAFRVPLKERVSGIPLILSDGTSPKVVRMLIHDIEFPKQPSRYLGAVVRSVEVIIRDDRPVEVAFKEFHSGGNNNVLVVGESTCQDVLSMFGGPSRSRTKDYEPLGTVVRRQGGGSTNSDEDVNDYFFNYNDLGFDLLFDGTKHLLKKVILRTNLVGHPVFGQYNKCSFSVKYVEANISTSSGRKVAVNGKPKKSATFEELLTRSSSSSSTTSQIKSHDKLVTCDDHWVLVAKKLDIIDEKPMVHERAEQPFGPCLLYGYRHSVFEVDEVSQQVCSLTVF